MKSNSHTLNRIDSIQLKLAALWTSFMFFYIYVDYFHLYMPGMLQDVQQGKVYLFDITSSFIFIAMVSVSIPALMIFLSVFLEKKWNRWVNGVVAVLYIPYTLFNLVGEVWLHMVYAAGMEVLLLSLILYHVWRWTQIEKE
ncbi:MAG: DUF6326 family protein [Cytophagaceae bacterium]|jgi:hypothetical protein|nr:DUF6326 family protein [Cytophagaceae bacterium]